MQPYQQQYAPQGYQPQQQYQQAPPQQPAYQMPVVIDATVSGGSGLKVRNLEGRAVLITPKTIDRNGKPMNAKPGDGPVTSIVADVIVLDGGVVRWGDDADKGLPHTFESDTPCEILGMWTSNTNIVRALEGHVGTGHVISGRIVRSDVGQRPWNLVPFAPDDPARAMVNTYYQGRASGQLVNPTPREINGGPRARAPQQGQQNGGQYAPPQQQYAQQQYAASAQAYAQPAGVVPQVQYAQPMQQQAPPGAAMAIPPGWTPEIWNALTPQQQAQITGQPGM